MINLLKKDLAKRCEFAHIEVLVLLINYVYKSTLYGNSKVFIIKTFCFFYVSLVALKNFCILSSRSRSIFGRFGLSRILLKEFLFSSMFYTVNE